MAEGKDVRSYLVTEHSGNRMEYLYGREPWKQTLLSYIPDAETDEALAIGRVHGILLHGPFASGKRSLLDALAGEMAEQGYRYLGADLRAVPREAVPAVFDSIGTTDLPAGPVFLYLDHPECLQDPDPVWRLYEEAEETDASLILAAAAEDVSKIDADLRRLFTCYYVGLPSGHDREAYFTGVFQDSFDHFSAESIQILTEETEGYSYVQMNALADAVRMRVKASVISGGKTLRGALYMLDADLVRDVLTEKEPAAGGRSQAQSGGLSAEDWKEILGKVVLAGAGQTDPGTEGQGRAGSGGPAAAGAAAGMPPRTEEEKREDVMSAFRAKYAMDEVFNQDVYLTDP